MDRLFLDRIREPSDLADLSLDDLAALGGEIRDRLIEVVNLNGGHLASNLGVVELTLALHRAFDFRTDRLVWDVSHQTYVHKLITGRNELFGSLRQYDGCCGFASKAESPFDLFDAGHAGTSISAALGISVADASLNPGRKSVAVVGDASVAAGMIFEALNHTGDLQQDQLVVLNDNRMSIDHSVGAFSKYLNRMRSGSFYRGLKRDVQVLLPRIPVVGKPFEEALEHLHESARNALLPGQFFEEMGFKYFGPVDGHDLPELEETLQRIREMNRPVLLHVVTNKGQGYAPAQDDPIKYHASKGFLPSKGPKEPPTVKAIGADTRPSFSEVFRDTMLDLAERDPDVRAITAAMPGGTGLSAFQARFPDRFFDVGIAEQHATTFSSGLAFGGLKPVFGVYSTFLQRGYDQVIHDVCLQGNRVVFAMDRAGLVEDGPTHHGVFDIAYLRAIPRIDLAAPADADDLVEMMEIAVNRDRPSGIRYAKTAVPDLKRDRSRLPVEWGKAETLRDPGAITILAYGSMVPFAVEVSDRLEDDGISVGVINMRFCKPLDVACLRQIASCERTLITLEEHVLAGGFGSAVAEALVDESIPFDRLLRWGIPDQFVDFGKREFLLRDLQLDVDGLESRIRALVAPPAHKLAH